MEAKNTDLIFRYGVAGFILSCSIESIVKIFWEGNALPLIDFQSIPLLNSIFKNFLAFSMVISSLLFLNSKTWKIGSILCFLSFIVFIITTYSRMNAFLQLVPVLSVLSFFVIGSSQSEKRTLAITSIFLIFLNGGLLKLNANFLQGDELQYGQMGGMIYKFNPFLYEHLVLPHKGSFSIGTVFYELFIALFILIFPLLGGVFLLLFSFILIPLGPQISTVIEAFSIFTFLIFAKEVKPNRIPAYLIAMIFFTIQLLNLLIPRNYYHTFLDQFNILLLISIVGIILVLFLGLKLRHRLFIVQSWSKTRRTLTWSILLGIYLLLPTLNIAPEPLGFSMFSGLSFKSKKYSYEITSQKLCRVLNKNSAYHHWITSFSRKPIKLHGQTSYCRFFHPTESGIKFLNRKLYCNHKNDFEWKYIIRSNKDKLDTIWNPPNLLIKQKCQNKYSNSISSKF